MHIVSTAEVPVMGQDWVSVLQQPPFLLRILSHLLGRGAPCHPSRIYSMTYRCCIVQQKFIYTVGLAFFDFIAGDTFRIFTSKELTLWYLDQALHEWS
jgi:hypothetical protein